MNIKRKERMSMLNNYILDLKMYTREELAHLMSTHKDTITMLNEVGCILSIKIGKCYMFSYEEIKRFQQDYVGLDVSNRLKAIQAKKIVDERKGFKYGKNDV